jgi:transcriptional regulator with XRE-family HTH domain
VLQAASPVSSTKHLKLQSDMPSSKLGTDPVGELHYAEAIPAPQCQLSQFRTIELAESLSHVRFWERMLEHEWNAAARQMIAGLRGARPRALLSRRLGYRTNTVSDWEAGRRFPTAREFLRACALLRVDVADAFRRFHPATAAHVNAEDEFALDGWLRALRGRTPLSAVAARSGLSRFAVSRWLQGQAQPRLPDFLRLVEALTDRASDLADALVGVDKLPALQAQHQRRHAAKTLAFEHPDSEAVLRVMETRAYQSLPEHRAGVLAAALGISGEAEARVLAALEQAGILQISAGRYQPLQPLTVDTSAEPAALNRLKSHWARVALERSAAPRERDWLGYNLMSLSSADLERVREILRNAYREIRALAAASEPVETAALLNLQLVTFAPVDP